MSFVATALTKCENTLFEHTPVVLLIAWHGRFRFLFTHSLRCSPSYLLNVFGGIVAINEEIKFVKIKIIKIPVRKTDHKHTPVMIRKSESG